MRRIVSAAGTAVAVMSLSVFIPTGTSGAATDTASGGVTSTTISVGVPYPDLAVLTTIGINIDQGSYPIAYNSLVKYMNAHGGVDGRKLSVYPVGVSPLTSTAAQTACTQLTEDNKVFVAISPVQTDCFLQHQVSTFSGTFQTQPSSVAQNFTLTTPPKAFDPLQLSVFNKMGVFKNKKVAIFGGTSTDQAEMKIVQSSLRKLRVTVVQSALDSAPMNDEVAYDQQAQVIAQRFQSAGANLVVAVGTGSSSWPKTLQDNQSSYHPPWIATNEAVLASFDVNPKQVDPTYIKNVLAASSTPSNYAEWQDPAVQRCASIVKQMNPSYTWENPVPPTQTQDEAHETFFSSLSACQNLAMFAKIADAAGKHLTPQSFVQAGYGLRNVTFPGSGGPVSFGPNQPYAIGPVFLVRFDTSSNQLVTASKSST